MSDTRASRGRRRRGRALRRAAIVVAFVLVAFAVGIAVGKALNDGPPRPQTVTYVRTLDPPP